MVPGIPSNSMKKTIQALAFTVFLGASSAHAGSYDQFFTALKLDDGRTVQQLLSRGFDPNTPDEKGEPPLVAALRDGHLEVADVLLRHPDIKVDRPNLNNETPLMMASLRGFNGHVQRLIERGAAVNRKGWSPLLYAATGGDVKTIEILVQAGADLQAVNASGSGVLHMAARFGRDEVALALVRMGLDPRRQNPAGQDAVAAARWAGRDRLADQLERLTLPPSR